MSSDEQSATASQRDDISTRRSNEPREERNWRVAGANDLTMLSFCPIMDRLCSSLGYRRSFESAGTLPFKLNLYRFVLEPLLVTGFTSSYTSAASTAGGGGGGDGGGVRGGVPPISTFRSIRLLVRGGKGGCYSRVHRVLRFLFFLSTLSPINRYIL